MNQTNFADHAPEYPHLTDYDRAHLKDYLRLLDAAEAKADWREVALVVFGLDPQSQPERARSMHDSHLARARWISQQGYRDLVWGEGVKP